MKIPENIEEIAKRPLDYIGFIFYPKSKRFVGDLNISGLPIPSHIQKTGVFVNEKVEKMQELAKKHQLNVLQLHGKENPEECRRLKESGYTVIKAFGVHTDFGWNTIKPYEEHVDFFLFDTQSPHYGGTGKTFDWTILKAYPSKKPYFLSGGIDANNFEEAYHLTDERLYALDINSRFETEPGIKNIELIDKTLDYIK